MLLRAFVRLILPAHAERRVALVIGTSAPQSDAARDDKGHSRCAAVLSGVKAQSDPKVGRRMRTLCAKLCEKPKGRQVPVERALCGTGGGSLVVGGKHALAADRLLASLHRSAERGHWGLIC